MKYSIDLKVDSSPEWIATVKNDFDAFLIDHANCERKASSMAMNFVAKYPNRTEIIPELIATAVEELEHFQMVYELMEERGLQLPHTMEKDPYVQELMKLQGDGIDQRFMDRLLLASVIECRGAERFRLVSEMLEHGELKQFYKKLWASEAKHGNIFVHFALNYFEEDEVYKRLDELMTAEGEILQNLSLRPALH